MYYANKNGKEKWVTNGKHKKKCGENMYMVRWDFYTFSVHCIMSNVSCITWKCRQSQCQVNINFLAVSVFNFSWSINATRQIFNVLCTHIYCVLCIVYFTFCRRCTIFFMFLSSISFTSFRSSESHTQYIAFSSSFSSMCCNVRVFFRMTYYLVWHCVDMQSNLIMVYILFVICEV